MDSNHTVYAVLESNAAPDESRERTENLKIKISVEILENLTDSQGLRKISLKLLEV